MFKTQKIDFFQILENFFQISSFENSGKAFFKRAFGRRYLLLAWCLTVKIADISRGHYRNEQHCGLEYM